VDSYGTLVLDEVVCSVDDVIGSFEADVDFVADGHVDDRPPSDSAAHGHVAPGPRRPARRAGLAKHRVGRAGARRTPAAAAVSGRDVGGAALTGDGEVVEREANGLPGADDDRPRRQHRPAPGQLGHQTGQEAGRRRADRCRARVDAEIASRLNCSRTHIQLLDETRLGVPTLSLFNEKFQDFFRTPENVLQDF